MDRIAFTTSASFLLAAGDRALHTSRAMVAAVGSKFPVDTKVHLGFKNEVTMGDLINGKKILLVSLPGAFTPT